MFLIRCIRMATLGRQQAHKLILASRRAALVVIWIAAYFVIRMREQRELQREIDELNDIERENRR